MEGLKDSFLGDCKARGMAPNTVLHYGYCIKQFLDYLDSWGADPLAVTKGDLRGFIEHLRRQGKEQKTIENYFSALGTYFEFLTYEEMIQSNPLPAFRKRYLRRYKNGGPIHQRKLLSVEEMALLVNSTLDIKDRAVLCFLAKTGIRRNELASLDLEDLDLVEMRATLKPTPKRSNRVVFFDAETSYVLRRWLQIRENMDHKSPALFLNAEGERLMRSGIYNLVVRAATKAGLHDPESQKTEDHVSPHCLRHWHTTWLMRAGMSRDYVKILRGDSRSEAIDIYHHVDLEDVRRAYLASIPQLGI